MDRQHTRNVLAGLTLLTLITGLTACGGGGDSAPAPTPPPQPASTAVGVIDNTKTGATATLTSGGGSLSTADGKITLTVPAGALTTDTLITISRITNTAHGGIGGGFRLEPDGKTFNTPVTLTLAYTDGELNGNEPGMLGVAFQTASGFWQWLGTPVINATERTVSITTTHFTDFSMVKGFQLQPPSKTIKTNATAALNVVYCYTPSVPDTDMQPLGYDCDTTDDDLAPLLPTSKVSNWSVNGTTGGNSSVGTVSGNDMGATYTAPSTSPGTVAVSARVDMGGRGNTLLVSNITVEDQITYTGTVNFNLDFGGGATVTNAVATVTWTQFEDLGDVRSYVPTGTIRADLNYPDCDPKPNVTVPIEATVPHGPGATLVVYTATNAGFPSTHQFGLAADDTVITFTCGDNPRYTIPVEASGLINILVGGCTGTNFPPFTNEDELSGSYSCPMFGVTDSSWTFTRQN